VESSPKEKDVQLSEAEEIVRTEYNQRFGLNISKAEWRAISSGQVLPKKRGTASDWQKGVPSEAKFSTSEG